MSKPSEYIKIERRIAGRERGGLLDRWRYGRALLKAKEGRKGLPHGMTAELIAEAAREGITICAREIQFRVQFAELYTTESGVDEVMARFGSWSALRESGFPPLFDELELDDLARVDETPDEFVSAPSGIPGFKSKIRLRGEEIPIEQATVGDLVAYRDKYRHMHDGFAKSLDLIERTVNELLSITDDESENAVDAWKRGCGS